MDWKIDGYRGSLEGHLHIDGVKATELASKFGTPLFAFSERRIRENIENLRRQALLACPRVKICYAAKANSLLGILNIIRLCGSDIEVNSGGELFKALQAGFRPDQIVFNGVSKTITELAEAIQYGLWAINVDSPYELDVIAQLAKESGKKANIAIRIVPDIETCSHAGLQTALFTSKFGVSPAQVPDLFRRALEYKESVTLVGLHIHVGSQTPDVEPYARAFALMWKYLAALYRETGHRLQHINLGGGMPVTYLHDANHAAAISDKERRMLRARLNLTDVIRSALDAARRETDGQMWKELLEGVEIVLEPGRSIIADAGTLLTTIRNVKRRPETGDTWLMLDAGSELLLSMSNYKWYYQIVAAERPDEPHETPYKVAGPLCDGGDVYFDIEGRGRLPDYRLLPQGMSVGELLAVLDAGAYSVAQMSSYNGRLMPAVVLIRPSGDVQPIRRRDTYEDLLRGEFSLS